MLDKRLISKIYKNSTNSIIKETNNPIQKQAVKLHRSFFQEGHTDGFFHLRKNEIKRGSASLIIKKKKNASRYGKQQAGALKS